MSKSEVIALCLLTFFGFLGFVYSQTDFENPGVNFGLGVITGISIETFGIILGASLLGIGMYAKGKQDQALLKDDLQADIKTMEAITKVQNSQAHTNIQQAQLENQRLKMELEVIRLQMQAKGNEPKLPESASFQLLPGAFDTLEADYSEMSINED